MLCEGEIIYDGPPDQITERIEEIGLTAPDHVPPIEFLMKAIDKEEIKIEFEKIHGALRKHDPKVVDKLYFDRINLLIQLEKQKNYFKTKMSLSRQRISHKNNTSMLSKESLRSKQSDIEEKLLPDDLQEGETLLEYEARTTHQKHPMHIQTYLLTTIKMESLYKMVSTYILILVRQFLINGLLIALFHNLGDPEDDTLTAIQNRRGFYFLMPSVFFLVGLNSALTTIFKKKKMIIKDRDSQIYDLLPFYLAEQVHTMPRDIISGALSTLIFFYAIGLNKSPNAFKNLTYFSFLIVLGGEILGKTLSIILGIIGDSIEDAATLIPIIVVPSFITAGFVVDVKSMTFPIRILSYLSPIRFCFQGLILTEFQDKEKYTNTCVASMPCVDNPDENCSYPLPLNYRNNCDPDVLFNFYEDKIIVNIIILFILFFCYNLIAFFLLKRKIERGVMKYKPNDRFRAKFNHVSDKFETPTQSKLDPLIQSKYIKEQMIASQIEKNSVNSENSKNQENLEDQEN